MSEHHAGAAPPPTTAVELTAGEILSLLMQHKDRDLRAADAKLAEAYAALTGRVVR